MPLDLTAHGLTHPDRAPALPGPVQSIAHVLQPTLAEDGERTALVDEYGRYTFGQLDAQVQRAVVALQALGLTAGDRLAACTRNHNQLLVAFLASQRLGVIWVGINRPLAPPEKRYILQDAGAKVFLGDADMADQVSALELDLRVVRVDLEQTDCEWRRLLREARGEPAAVTVDPHAPAAIAYTSGTTGFPKGAVHSQHNLLLLAAVARAEGWYPRDMPHGVMLPLTTLNLIALVPLHTLLNGACCVVIGKGRAKELADWVRRERIGHFTAVPAIYYDLLTDSHVDPADLRSLVQPEMGGAHIPPAIRELYRERLGKDICVGYGMTEAPATVTRTRPDTVFEAGLVGHALPQYLLQVRDEQDRVLPVGEVGEVVLAAAQDGPYAGAYMPMLGYWNRPEATTSVLRQGRYYTGDLGRLDASGQLFILGRAREMILRGGANVYPAEVERVLHELPEVAAAAVVGVPDERLGERVEAYIEAAQGANPDPAGLRQACEAMLARYKVPDAFHFVAAMPRNAMGKILKRELGKRG